MMKIEAQIARFSQSIEDFIHCVASQDDKLFLARLYEWSPRDIAAHLVGWNRYIIRGSQQIIKGELPFYDDDPGEDYSKVNALLIREYASRNKQEMLDDLQASAQELITFLQSLDSNKWDHDFGIRHEGAVITIRNTMDEFIEDYDIHIEQIKKWERKKMKDKTEKYQCAHCGYTADGKFTGDICPDCGLTFWKCSNCGFLMTAATLPEECPSCKEKCEFRNVSCYTPECGGPGKIDPRLA